MEQISSQSEDIELTVARLIAETRSFLPWKRKHAERVLLERKDEFFEPLLSLFEDELRKNKDRSSRNSLNEILYSGLGLIISITIYLLFLKNQFITSLIYVGVCIGIDIYMKRRKNLNLLGSQLAKYSDPRMLGPMIEVFAWDYRIAFLEILNSRSIYESALISALQAVRNENDVQLTPNQIHLLNSAVHVNKLSLSTAILNALRFTGNTESLVWLRRLSKSRIIIGHKEIPGIARECLPALEARVLNLSNSETLLRPSSAEDIGRDVLLRPVLNSGESASDELLRASSAE